MEQNRSEFEAPGEMPAWLQGLGIALLFGIVIFADAIAVWLS